ncbi:hypothetical protein [Dyadobacter sp. 32]|uniref:hypothetical protein n=1 Tax=Dyadobacter sp. 32 TaxID=538966 RepID=UPI0011ED6201
MATTQTSQIWQPQQLNLSGIRRLKLVDAESFLLRPLGHNTNKVALVQLTDVEFYEFIFPSDLSCVATTSLGKKESGYPYWVQNISFTLPHVQDDVIKWAAQKAEVRWLLITEAYNGSTRLLGGSPHGLDMTFQATTGSAPKEENPMAFGFTSEQLHPYLEVPGYDDAVLFPESAAFTYGFSLAFEA